MLIRSIRVFLTLILTAAVAVLGCKPASYELIKKKRVTTQNPQPVDGGGTNGLPIARVEVLRLEIPSESLTMNEEAKVRPHADTMDADDRNVKNCINPGITKADYDLGDGSPVVSVVRKTPCEPLDIRYTFKKTGRFVVKMTVTSNENETASHQVNVTVFDPNDPNNPNRLTLPSPRPSPGITDPNQKPGQRFN